MAAGERQDHSGSAAVLCCAPTNFLTSSLLRLEHPSLDYQSCQKFIPLFKVKVKYPLLIFLSGSQSVLNFVALGLLGSGFGTLALWSCLDGHICDPVVLDPYLHLEVDITSQAQGWADALTPPEQHSQGTCHPVRDSRKSNFC